MLGRPVSQAALCGDIDLLGITGTPVIDTARGTVYLAAMIYDRSISRHLVNGLRVADGSVLPGFPINVAATRLGVLRWTVGAGRSSSTADGSSEPIIWAVGAHGDGRLHGFRGDNGKKKICGQKWVGKWHEPAYATSPPSLSPPRGSCRRRWAHLCLRTTAVVGISAALVRGTPRSVPRQPARLEPSHILGDCRRRS